MKALARAAAVLGVLALGSAGFAGTAAAAPGSFEVCGPLGCAAQSIRTTIGRGEAFATLTDNSPASTLIAQFIVSPPTQVSIIQVGDGETVAVIMLPSTWRRLTVKACADSMVNCNSESIIRLP
ncbi:hypothetical protein [Amycolatopsis speibonae]|uniref:Uncharacterized protein n=1 Tax=Amycolatopsis speibonae TaxID=1450224 RepID=A0ABV7NVI7_9PSEU